MPIKTNTLFNTDLIKITEKISTSAVNSALELAEKRLDLWVKKGYYERVVFLAKAAENIPDKTGLRFQFINLEIKKLLTQSSREIALL